MAYVLYTVKVELERSDMNVWFRLNVRPRVPSEDERGSVDTVAVVTAPVVLML